MAGFGGSVKLTGEAAYRQALNAIAADLKNVAAQQKLTAATYDKTDNSLTALSKRSEELKTKLAAQQERVKTLTTALKDYQAQQEKNKNTIQGLQEQLDKEKTKLEQIAKQYGTASDEYKNQAKIVDGLEQQLKELNTQYDKNETTIKKTQAALTSAEADVKKTGTAMEKLGKQAEEAGVGADKLGLAVDESGKKAEKSANGGYTVFKNVLANLATQIINKAIDGVKRLGSAVYDAGMNFDTAMSKVQAISGASAADMTKLTAKAKEMGETTKFSATESAEALTYMAMAGWKTEDMLNGLPGIMNLAAASGSELATTSDIVTDALTAMGYSAKDAGKLADVMAAASSNANTNVEMMGETFKYAATVAGSLGYSMEDVALATGLMANAGVKGERAGTALRAIMQRLATDTGGATTALHDLGIATTNADGTMRPLSAVMGDLRGAMANLTDEQKTATAKTIAGTEAMGGLLAIVNASETDYQKLTQAINGSTGAADKMAKTMQNNVGGKMTLLKSQLEGIYLTIWQKVEPVISKTIDSISKSLKDVNWDKFGETASKALEKVADGFKWLLENKELVINAMKAILAAFAVAKIASFTKSLSENLGVTSLVTAAQKSLAAAHVAEAAAQGTATAATTAGTGAMRIFNTVLAANPIGLVVTALGLLGTALFGIASAFNSSEKEAVELSGAMKDTADAVRTTAESWDQIVEARQEALDSGMSELGYYQNLADELETIIDANGRVKQGYEARAQFITSTLSKALGVEISYQDGIVNGYQKIRDSIDATIEKKKAELILNSQEAAYSEAIQNRSEALKRQTELQDAYMAKRAEARALDDEIEAAQAANNAIEVARWLEKQQRLDEEATKLQSAYNEQTAILNEYAYNVAQYEDNMAKFHEGKYDEMTQVNWDYISSFDDMEDAKAAQIQQDIQNEDNWIKTLQGMRNEANAEMIDSQIEAANKRKSNLQEQMKQYNSITDNELKNNNKSWLENAATVISKLTDKNIEFKKTGEGQVQFYEDGLALGAPMAEKEAEKIAKDTLAKFDKQAEAEGAGKNVITGFTRGEGNLSLQNTAFSTARSFGSSILSNLKKTLGIASPSKKTREMGRYLVQGLGLGIEKEENTALTQVEDFGDQIIDTLSGALEQGTSTKALEALKTALPADFDVNLGANTSRMAEAAQNANKSLVAQFKQALSEMKIEMDDIAMGRFVDDTVTKLVYN